MKTLYTGHVTLHGNYVYSFIYAATLLEAEQHLTTLMQRYVKEHCNACSALPVAEVKVVSRPGGWNPPDGYYLPGTSKQYALRYAPQQTVTMRSPDIHATTQPELKVEEAVTITLSQNSSITI